MTAPHRPTLLWRLAGPAMLFLLVVGLSACEDPPPEPPEPGKPVLQIQGTKPPSIDLSLRLRYVATTKQRQCQQYDLGIPGYKPSKPTWHIWPQEPPSQKPNRRDRVVPINRTGSLSDSLKGEDLEPFRWTVNTGWGGKPIGCDFKLDYITLQFRYDKEKDKKFDEFKNSSKAGYVYLDLEDKCKKENVSRYKIGLDKNELIECKKGGFENGLYHRSKVGCRLDRGKLLGYCIERNVFKKIETNMKIRYVKN